MTWGTVCKWSARVVVPFVWGRVKKRVRAYIERKKAETSDNAS